MDVLNGLRFGFGRKLRVMLGTEAAECGLVCLAMIASYHGYRTDLPDLRRKFSLSLKGASLRRLIDIAARLGFQGRPLRLELGDLPQLQTPCVLHWDLDHFVVLKKATGATVVIHDPAFGLRTLSLAEASRHFTGVALELIPTADFKTQAPPPAVSIRQLTGRVTGLWRSLALILLLSLALQVFVVLGPFFLQWIVDQCEPEACSPKPEASGGHAIAKSRIISPGASAPSHFLMGNLPGKVQFQHLEIRGKVEIAGHDVARMPSHDAGARRVVGRWIGNPDHGLDGVVGFVESLGDERRTDDLAATGTAEIEGAAPEFPGQQVEGRQVAGQVQDIAAIVLNA